jgi:hypothetical protein
MLVSLSTTVASFSLLLASFKSSVLTAVSIVSIGVSVNFSAKWSSFKQIIFAIIHQNKKLLNKLLSLKINKLVHLTLPYISCRLEFLSTGDCSLFELQLDELASLSASFEDDEKLLVSNDDIDFPDSSEENDSEESTGAFLNEFKPSFVFILMLISLC